MASKTVPAGGEQLFTPSGMWGEIDEEFGVLWPEASTVEGWLSKGQARILYRAATLASPGHHIVEIGSHHGRSTVFQADAKSPEVPLLAVDPFDDPRWGGGPEALQRFRDTMKRFDLLQAIKIHRGTSAEASTAWEGDPVDLLFIDGSHAYASVLMDIDGWEPHMTRGAIVLFHDAFSSVGVTRALTIRHFISRRFFYLGAEGSLACFQRRDLQPAEAAVSSLRMASRYPWFVRNVMIKLALRYDWSSVASLLGYRSWDDLY